MYLFFFKFLYTLLYLKWEANRDLLYSTENTAQIRKNLHNNFFFGIMIFKWRLSASDFLPPFLISEYEVLEGRNMHVVISLFP